jgi:WD40 repeat protein
MSATASFDTTIINWKRKSDLTFEIVANLKGHENEVKCTAWSRDGAFLASCSRDRSVWIWDGRIFAACCCFLLHFFFVKLKILIKTLLLLVSDEEEYECSSVLTIHTQDVKHVLWHPHKQASLKLFHEPIHICCVNGRLYWF